VIIRARPTGSRGVRFAHMARTVYRRAPPSQPLGRVPWISWSVIDSVVAEFDIRAAGVRPSNAVVELGVLRALPNKARVWAR
jgi:hypothetical protein